MNLIFNLTLKYIKRRLKYERKIDINYLEKNQCKGLSVLPLFCVTTGISHRVQLAILANFPNAVLNAKRFYEHLKFQIYKKTVTT